MQMNFVVFLFLLIVTFPIHGSSQVLLQNPFRFCSNATFSPNTTYLSNLDTLSSALSSNASRQLYYQASVGRPPNPTTYANFQCRGDLNASACQHCVAVATSNSSQQFCPLSVGAIIWFDECSLRYSNKSFFTRVAKQPSLILMNSANIEVDVDGFNQVVVSTLTDAATRASNASVEGSLLFATQEARFRSETIFTLAQCTGDLSRSNCGKCLTDAVQNFPKCCSGKKGGRVLLPSCTVRYELYAFYKGVSLSPSASPSGMNPSPSPAPLPTPSLPSSPSAPVSTPSLPSAPAPSTAAPPPLSGKSRATMATVIGIVAGYLLS